jgi:hypothetical protein
MWSQAAANFGVKSYSYQFTDPQAVAAFGGMFDPDNID